MDVLRGSKGIPEGCPSVGIVMIPPNNYLLRWFSAAASLEQSALKACKSVKIHLFTNRNLDAESWATINLRRIELVVHQIYGWGWPEATLYRYRFIQNAAHLLSEDILIYLDSDMHVATDFTDELFSSHWHGGLAFVQHPGYYRNSGMRGIYDYLVNPKRLLTTNLLMPR